MRPLAAADFETDAIGPRPGRYPPRPVGLAVTGDGLTPRYLSWGHPSGNNSSEGEARGLLKRLYRDYEVVFHHAAFDCEVAHVHWGLPLTPDVYHDTLFLAFLVDPRSPTLELKPLCERWLGMRPAERDRLKEWIEANFKCTKDRPWGSYIAQAPASLVEPYGKGDAVRTLRLFKFLRKELARLDAAHPSPSGATMAGAYDRERALMPVLVRMEARGIPVALNRLRRDVPRWKAARAEFDREIIRRLGGPRKVARFAKDGEPFNIGSGPQLAAALDAAGKMRQWTMTKPTARHPKGQRSTTIKALMDGLADQKLLAMLQHRGIYDTYIDVYGDKWLQSTDGRTYPRISQTRNSEGGYLSGARTGRLSYSDSWQAIPSIVPRRRIMTGLAFEGLPILRDYIVPSDGVLAVRDYSQQEFRILAHYEAGPLLARYREDPAIDMHEEAAGLIRQMGLVYDRRAVKDIGFSVLYGMGLKTMSAKMGKDEETVKAMKKAYLDAIPGLKNLLDGIKMRCASNEPIRTWGGRLYWVEPPAYSKKFDRIMTFDYKMINVLIQGSAADCTKEAMVRADAALPADCPLLFQQHDELALDTPGGRLTDRGMRALREAMESVEFDVLMLSDGKASARSWGACKPYKDRR